jgi:D-alanyl-D-alanine carboxypeptidase
MIRSLLRSLYRCLLQLHPPDFRHRFAPEMLWIYDEIADRDARLELYTDALASLMRQWVVRYAIQKLLIGEFQFAPVPATNARLTWERIGFDDPPLPAPRMIQGSALSLAFLACICAAAFHASAIRNVGRIAGTAETSSQAPAFSGANVASPGDPDGGSSLSNTADGVAIQQSNDPQNPASHEKIPNTPAGHQFSAWLAAFNRGDKAVLQQFLTENFPSRAAEVDMEMGFREQTGGFDLMEVGESTPVRFSGMVKERGSDQFAHFTMEVEPADAHHIVSLELRVIPRPAEFPLQRLNEAAALEALRDKIEQEVAADRFSGAVIVAKNGKPIYSAAYGLADREKKIPNTLTTKFHIGSMNKMLTATAILQLNQAGKLQLTDPLGKYLTDYPNKDVASKVTIEQLLSHTGGTGDFFGPEFDKHRLELKTLQDYVKLYGQRAPEFAPGTRWEYSNYGFLLLGLVVEKASGQDYYQYVRDHIYKPAGMTGSDSLPEDETVADRSIGYTKFGGGTSWKPNNDTLPYRGTSAGGGYSTVGDLLAFATAVQNRKLLDDAHTSLLTTGHTDVAPGEKYAYGFMDSTEGGVRSLGHGGGAPGMNGELRIYPNSGYTVVVLANEDPPVASRIASYIGNRLPQ